MTARYSPQQNAITENNCKQTDTTNAKIPSVNNLNNAISKKTVEKYDKKSRTIYLEMAATFE